MRRQASVRGEMNARIGKVLTTRKKGREDKDPGERPKKRRDRGFKMQGKWRVSGRGEASKKP